MYHLIDFCRLCLCFKGEFSNMCNDDVMEKIVACISDLEFDEQLPALICTKCSEQLDMFFDFRNQCLRSEFLLNCYIDKFPLAQSCNKFVNTRLKVNVFKNFAPSSKLQSNVQIFKEYSLKPYNNNAKENLKICERMRPSNNYSSNGHKRCGIILKDIRGSGKPNVNNNDQNEIIQLNKLHSITEGSANPCVADNDVNTYVNDTILDEDEDDIFLEEEDDEVVQLTNVNNGLNSKNSKRKSDHSENSFNKKSKLETEQTNRMESNNLNKLENGVNFLAINMQADITEHVKISKRTVQIRAQEKIKQAVDEKVETKAKKAGNRKKSTSGCYSRTSHNVKTVNIKSSKLLNSMGSSRSTNIKQNKLHNTELRITNNSTSCNTEKNKLQNFNDNPVIHNNNRDKVMDVKLQNIKNSPLTPKIANDEFENRKSHNFISSLVTCNMQANNVKVTKLLNFGSNSVIQNREATKVKDTKLQNLETNSAFMIHNIEKDEFKSIIHPDSENISHFLTRNTDLDAVKISALLNLRYNKTDPLKDPKSQNLENSSMTHLQNINNNTVICNIETDEMMKCKLQEINCPKTYINKTNKIQGAESNKLDIPESQNWKNKPVTRNNEQDNAKKCEPLNMNNNLKNYNNILDVDSANLGSRSVTQLIVINKTVNVDSPPLESIPMALNEEQKIPFKVSSNLNKCPDSILIPQKTWHKLDEERGATNKELNKDETESFSLLSVQNTQVVQTNKTVLTQSYPDNSSTYQTVLTQSIPQRSFGLPINNETHVQNLQTMSVTEMNRHKVKSTDSPHSPVPPQKSTKISVKPSQLISPKQIIAMHDRKPMTSMLKNGSLKNSSNFVKSKTNLFKIKNIQHSDELLVDNETFKNSTNGTSNLETNITVPLNSRGVPVKNSFPLRSNDISTSLFTRSVLKSNNKHSSLIRRDNEKSALRISNRESKQPPNIKIANVYSLTEKTVVTQLPSNIHSVCEDIKLESKPSLRFDGQSNSKSKDCDTYTIDASLAKENFCVPHDDHNYISNTKISNLSFLSEIPSTSTAEFKNCNDFSVVSTLVLKDCRIPHTNHSYNSNTNNTHFLNDVPSSSSASSTISKMPVYNSKMKSNQVTLGKSTQTLHMEKDDSNKLENATTTDSEDSEIDVVTVSEPYKLCSSPYLKEDKINKNKAMRQSRKETRKYLKFLHSIIPNNIILPSEVSVRAIVDAAINYIQIVKTDSYILEKKYTSELHKQNKLIKKLHDIKKIKEKI